MAKSDSFFGLRRGSTKTLTFSVLKGKQITKDRVEGGRNPRTPEQMVQRMCMATASAAYAQMKQIVDHSFEGITYGQTTMSEFIRVNADALRKFYYEGDPTDYEHDFSYNPYRDRNCYMGAYLMARGTAAALKDMDGAVFGTAADNVQVIFPLYHGGDNTDYPQDLLNTTGLKIGDLATVCFLWEDDTDASCHFGFVRLTVLASSSEVALTTDNLANYFKIESNLPFTIAISDHDIRVNVTAENYVVGGAVRDCCIHSVKSNKGWLRSNAWMHNYSRVLARPSAEDAIETYPVGPSYVLNGGSIED